MSPLFGGLEQVGEEEGGEAGAQPEITAISSLSIENGCCASRRRRHLRQREYRRTTANRMAARRKSDQGRDDP